ncbi:delta14-sterol reductase [Klebsormidium nitens]|uniref:Delta(14)-sterol reductase n=1 Tax=Klebsormidium nitens TaxID=105231 RepID=A0A1Y1I8N8_KLENI|nr:delta14-sterol reductase [Klebsormidium nitens]|eukprot:GAQ87345.1 delta14-sterol reductase [Klebsormidium nitens]
MRTFEDVYGLWLSSKCPVAGAPTLEAALVILGYITFLAIAGAILPGKTYAGTVLADGSRISYKCNGFLLLLVLLASLGGLVLTGVVDPKYIARNRGALFTTDLAIAFALSCILYVQGLSSSSKAASFEPHVTSNPLQDWWCGVQLNPRFLGLDIKFFWYRPSMMGWLLINISLAAQQLDVRGSVSLPMILYQAFTAFYIFDYFWHEEYVTSTWDIIAEHFGFMLVFGDIVWIPFTFSIQGWWLLQHDPPLSPFAAAILVALFLAGYAIFRGCNSQKHEFKRDPTAPIWGRKPELVGGKLLVSGYWGLARKCNYLGDLMLAFSYSLPCGFSSIIPYFYPTYLLILLINRQMRDEARCQAKYKEVWTEYCKRVPYRIVPYVF